ncbi:hypothetical protein [Streptomyces luteireticuli]|uniref:hypothetical protein n=1 Tax=Streptomyces luteireticuli TaxID=173858 RepID=UPI003557E3FD
MDDNPLVIMADEMQTIAHDQAWGELHRLMRMSAFDPCRYRPLFVPGPEPRSR